MGEKELGEQGRKVILMSKKAIPDVWRNFVCKYKALDLCGSHDATKNVQKNGVFNKS